MHDLSPYLSEQLTSIWNGIPYFMPEIYLSALFIIVLITDLLFGKNSEKLCRIIAFTGILLVAYKDIQQYSLASNEEVQMLFNDMLVFNRTSVTFKLLIDCVSFLLLLYMGWDDKLSAHPKRLSDLYTIVVGSILGLHLMCMSVNLLAIYLSIEMVSIASYLMAAYRSESKFSAEAGMKYVLFGAAASAILLYGISLLYGFTGTLNIALADFGTQLAMVNTTGIAFAIVLVLVGIGFKLSFVPVHFWVPDVYEGAPTPVTAYLSTVPKIAAFALLVNFLPSFIFYDKLAVFDFRLVLSVIGVVTMVAGNFAAVSQNNVKRMLAYSSIGHTGFALMAIVTFSPQGLASLIYYLAVYALANIAALVLATYFANATGAEKISDYKGLGLKYPVASVCFVIVLISLTGLPVSAGFIGKLFVFSAVYGVYETNHNVWLLILLITGAITTVVALFYYIKIPLNLFLKKKDSAIPVEKSLNKVLVFSIIASLVLILLGIFPDYLYNWI
ncbi:NADH-quinone oxidoreductase subunit N [Mucilaginibacter gynuensis]|uniref:NADH-quinone oxidoreductase subunit N n=1 Tax=Mucilaginibacter gynuensis TaxID=1302236 RepID=A0ABP8HBW0_9SPHI